MQWDTKGFHNIIVSPVLMQNDDIWNFQASLTLNKGKLTDYFGSL